MTYFRTGGPYYHRRAAVSRSCSVWEGVGPAGCGRQALTGNKVREQVTDEPSMPALTAVFGRQGNRVERIGAGQVFSVTCYLTADYCYGVKPHGPLVPVSSTRYRASTPGLSTWWSATTLLGGQASGTSHLQARFPLRCFQRLSLPYIATRHCDWRHNRYTSGTSTPVLSY